MPSDTSYIAIIRYKQDDDTDLQTEGSEIDIEPIVDEEPEIKISRCMAA